MDHPNGDGCTDSRIKMWGTLERELARRCWWYIWIAEKWTAAILTQYVVSLLAITFKMALFRFLANELVSSIIRYSRLFTCHSVRLFLCLENSGRAM